MKPKRINVYFAENNQESRTSLENCFNEDSVLNLFCCSCSDMESDIDKGRLPDLVLLVEPETQKTPEDSAELLNPENRIASILRETGMPVHIIGYSYIREAVFMVLSGSETSRNSALAIYTGLAEKYRSTPSRVERAVRHAIEIVWSRGGEDRVKSVLGLPDSYKASRPTNREFIALVADKLRVYV